MNYGITADKVGTRSYFDAAVDNKCRLLKAEVSELANNNTVIDLTYVTEDGLCNQLQRIFPVNASNLTPRQGQTFDEMEAELVKNFNTKLRHIATKFNLSEEDFAKIDGSPFGTENDWITLRHAKRFTVVSTFVWLPRRLPFKN
jgi:hypothetical protein